VDALRCALALTDAAVTLLPPQEREAVALLRRAVHAPIKAIVAMEDAEERDTLLRVREMVAELGLARPPTMPPRPRQAARGRRPRAPVRS